MGKLAIGDWFVPEDGFDVDRDVSTHKPVLLGEVVRFLNPRADGVYVDATLGGGGYTEAILRASAPRGRVLALDRDPEAIRRTGKRLASYGERLRTVHGSFADLRAHIEEDGNEAVNGIVADLGLSSDQLGNPGPRICILARGSARYAIRSHARSDGFRSRQRARRRTAGRSHLGVR